MSDFDKERFSELLKKAIGNNRSISDFSKDSNVARPYISNFVNCKLDNRPRRNVIEKFAKAAANNVDVADLLIAAGYELDSTDVLNLKFSDMFEDLKASSSAIRNKVDSQYEQTKKVILTHVRIPVLFTIDPVTIISHNEDDNDPYDYIAVPEELKDKVSNWFYYVVDDQSMYNARIHEGDRVLIAPDKPYHHNDILLILKDGEAFLRRYKKLSNIHLFQAENNNFDSFDVTNTDLKKSVITIIGAVQEVKITTPL